ncbi:MAG: DUF86 domain-containing protein [Oscillospiraceae bacterium]|nr:DUF86 domain-containing protein [Oscillospiraceae bacterium]
MNNESAKDLDILRHILNYCSQIIETKKEFDNSKKRFSENATFRNAVCLCLLQIGELVTILSDKFKKDNPEIEWRDIKLLRNIVAHRYGKIDYDIIWDICLTDVPEMADFCMDLLDK